MPVEYDLGRAMVQVEEPILGHGGAPRSCRFKTGGSQCHPIHTMVWR